MDRYPGWVPRQDEFKGGCIRRLADLHIARIRQGLYVTVPVPLVCGDVMLQLGRQCPVESLGLTFCLRMIGRRNYVPNSEKAPYSIE